MRRRAQWSWIAIDIGNSAFATTILAALFPATLPHLVPKEGVQGPFGVVFDALSLWSYSVALSVGLTLLLAPIMGRWADRTRHRKSFFLGFSTLGIVGTWNLAWSDTWAPALCFFILANIGFVISNIFCNALLSSVADKSEWHHLSLKGYAWGYLGGGLLLGLQLLALKSPESFGLSSTQEILPYCFASVALWWAIYIIPAALFLPSCRSAAAASESEPALPAWKQWYSTLRDIVKTRHLALFMLSFALFNEGIQTVIAMSSIYGKEVLGLETQALIQTFLVIQLLGFPCSLAMNHLVRRLGAYQSLIAVLIVWMLIVSFGFFMTTAQDFLIMGVSVAVVLGVSQALPRSIFQSLLPEGREAEFFSFFSLSGKMTSVLGPLLFGLIRQITGDSRLSLLSLLAFFALGLVVLLQIPRRQGAVFSLR